MSFSHITTKYHGPLEAAHVHMYHDRYDMAECDAAGRPKLDLSDKLQCRSIASNKVIIPRSVNELHVQ